MQLQFVYKPLALSIALLLGACQPAAEKPTPATSEPAVAAETATAKAADPVQQTQPGKAWWQDAVFYQIWPRSFADSNADGHGDFNGIRAKIPYLQDLGVDALWLTPIFEAPSYHGYDFTEFYQVEADYGNMADFEGLVQEAKAKNIQIILDLVINHISDQHDWFKRSAAGEVPYKDYFIWRDEIPADGWGPAWDASKVDPKMVWHFNPTRKAYYYAAFGGSQPDLNLTHPDVVAEMKKMAKFWLDKGVAGFRLDAVRYAIENGPGQQADTAETIAYWQDFSAYVRSVQPNAMLVGEAWADLPVAAKYYGEGKALDAGFDFDFGYKVLALLQSAGGVKAEFGTMQDAAAEQEKTGASQHELQKNYQQRIDAGVPMGYFSPFITNHDQPRTGWQLQGDQQKAKLAAAMLFASPGSTYLYYGEEIGLTQASDAEHIQRRAPMLWDQTAQAGFTTAAKSWVESADLFPPQHGTDWWAPFLAAQLKGGLTVAEQQQQKTSLWSLYKMLIQLKKQRPELGVAGEFTATTDTSGQLLQITRQLNGKSTVFVLNMSAEPLTLTAGQLPDSSFQLAWAEQADPAAATTLAPWQLRIYHN
ncbi:alpha-amlyase [Rheinheimera sp. SA_1]|uniref:alpha-amylase family glycosyl hydrolase n=1 Tax=Rheinheimera sp. SA_1 TaxID=1827365 RepID=UPI000800338D|nr:alpha-amylase family glycosyl hydrolase [Rheinheimera sp. SA_1]OBP13783.1 alpha-amlyase [Rheinheimera sp. SA_1]